MLETAVQSRAESLVQDIRKEKTLLARRTSSIKAAVVVSTTAMVKSNSELRRRLSDLTANVQQSTQQMLDCVQLTKSSKRESTAIYAKIADMEEHHVQTKQQHALRAMLVEDNLAQAYATQATIDDVSKAIQDDNSAIQHMHCELQAIQKAHKELQATLEQKESDLLLQKQSLSAAEDAADLKSSAVSELSLRVQQLKSEAAGAESIAAEHAAARQAVAASCTDTAEKVAKLQESINRTAEASAVDGSTKGPTQLQTATSRLEHSVASARNRMEELATVMGSTLSLAQDASAVDATAAGLQELQTCLERFCQVWVCCCYANT